MPPRDILHPAVLRCLIADGWRITHDPYGIGVGRRTLFVDLGAEKLIAAERDNKRIAVEVKTFRGQSDVRDLEIALGQYFLYSPLISTRDPGRMLYLAIPNDAYASIFEEPIGSELMAAYSLRLLVIDVESEVIAKWIPEP
ncbi:MAG: fatty-acid synthase [Planctomycetes bacterium]|nr:fatty-acid synthase [Planctomycetota bacterium]